MDYQNYIDLKKEHYDQLLTYVDSIENKENDEFFKIFDEQNNYELQLFIYHFIVISNHHFRTSNFFDKIEQIIMHIKNDLIKKYSNLEIFNIFQVNKRIILFLIEQKIIIIDSEIAQIILTKPNYKYYFYPEIKPFISNEEVKEIEFFLSNNFITDFDDFDKKRHIGENDSYICYLIRNDMIIDFISYTNRKNYSLSSKINSSIFETNSFLIKNKNTTLIEYAAFFGSIQIFNYLKFNNVALTESLWIYAVHSNNGELIHLLEEENIMEDIYNNDAMNDALIHSIKCNNTGIVNYLLNKYITNESNTIDKLFKIIIKYHYYLLFPNELKALFKKNLSYLIKYNYISLVDFISSTEYFDSNVAFESCVKYKKPCLIQRYLNKSAFFIEQLKGCTIITEIIVPISTLKIPDEAFRGCTSLKKITFLSLITEIGSFAFEGCNSLIDFEIPLSVSIIKKGAFKGCSSLKTVSIPSKVVDIDYQTFEGCSSLVEISLPQKLQFIGSYAFNGCLSLEKINIPSTVKDILKKAFFKCKSLKTIDIPLSIREISDYTFSECISLKQIVIPYFVNKIGTYAFHKCSSIEKVSFSSKSQMNKIDTHAFSECQSLIEFSIPQNVRIIGDYCFSGCTSLEKITIPSSVTNIGIYSFNKCSSLKSILIPSSIKMIKYCTFKKCTSLSNVFIPSSVLKIQSGAFKECTSLNQIILSISNILLDKNAFDESVKLQYQ